MLWWVRDPARAEYIRKNRHNPVYHPSCRFTENVIVTSQNAEIGECSHWFWVVPSEFTEEVAHRFQGMQPHLVVSGVKGLFFEESSNAESLSSIPVRISEKLSRIFPESEMSVLSGPTISREIVEGQPAAAVIASHSEETGTMVQNWFSPNLFRLYRSTDIVGVEICGAFKNVVAIAAGIASGLGFGSNSLSALITRGLIEMQRVATWFGANPQTVYGLAGLGDLIATCFSPFSRNVQYGKAIALSQKPELYGQVAEGVRTSRIFFSFATQTGLDLPITREVYSILFEQKPVQQALSDLLHRPLKSESSRNF